MTIKLNYKFQLNISTRRAEPIENIDPAVIFMLVKIIAFPKDFSMRMIIYSKLAVV